MAEGLTRTLGERGPSGRPGSSPGVGVYTKRFLRALIIF